MRRFIMLFVLSSMVFTGFLYSDDKKNTVERGWRFGDIDEVNRTKTRRSMEDILEEMLTVQKKQLKTQDEILSLLKEELDPTPKEITLEDGTKCIANSSAECFSMPLTPVAKRIPVFKNWLVKPSKEHAKALLRWQAKYCQGVFDASTTLGLATASWGKEAYPINYTSMGMTGTQGANAVIKDSSRIDILNSMSDKIELYLYMGLNPSLDIFGMTAYIDLMRKLYKLDIHVIFYNQGSLNVFKTQGKRIYDFKRFLELADDISVDKDAFEKQNIYTTPLLVINLKEKKEIQNIAVGKISAIGIVNKIFGFLKLRKMIKIDFNTGYEQWERSSSNEFIERDSYNMLEDAIDMKKIKKKKKKDEE